MIFVPFLLSIITATLGCPMPENIAPCTCDRPNIDGSAYVTCSKLDNDQDLVKVATSLKGRSYIYSFVIEDSIFNFIPSDTFKGVKFAELEIKDTSFRALTDTDVAFEGLEDHLEFFLMTRSTLMNDWDWSVFKNLNKLTKLDIIECDLDSIEDLGTINSTKISNVIFDHNKISYIHPEAFVNFKDLMFLSLDDNYITEVKRSMFPNPALELNALDFSHNQIEQLPSDIFTNMPNLKFLSIANNKILVLEEATLSPVWEDLEGFTAMGNDLRCDCRMSWVVDKKQPLSLRAVCSLPPELKGKNIGSLASKDVWCLK